VILVVIVVLVLVVAAFLWGLSRASATGLLPR
jgi:hypothetical protein